MIYDNNVLKGIFGRWPPRVAFFLKNFINKNSLYVLKRKWDFQIRLSKYDEAARKILLVQEQIELGVFSFLKIAETINPRKKVNKMEKKTMIIN